MIRNLCFRPFILSALSLIFVLFISCELDPDFKDSLNISDPPIADFTFSTETQPCEPPCEVSFTSTSLRAINHTWEFGDGSTSQEKNPKYTYQNAGTFNVKLTVENNAGTDEETKSVLIKSPIPTFFKVYGESGVDVGNSIVQSQGNFYLVTGHSNSPELLSGANTDHLIIWKFDLLGGKIWSVPKALKPNSYGNSIIEDGANFVIVGYERNTPGNSLIQSPVFVRYNTEGTILRLRDLSNPIKDFVSYTVIEDVIKVGAQYAITGFAELCAPGCPHIMLSYLDSNGEVVEGTYSTDSFTGNDARGHSITKSPLRVVSMGDQDGDIILRENPGINTMMFFDKIFQNGGSQSGNDMVGTNDGNFAITGSTDNGTNGGIDILFFLTDNDFNLVGDYVHLGGSVTDFAESIISTNDGFVIAGSTNSFSQNGDFDVYLLSVDPEGNINWSTKYENPGSDEFAREVIATSDGGYMVTGFVEYMNTSKDIFLLKTNSVGEVFE